MDANRLDRTDLALLAVLQQEGRISNAELAERVIQARTWKKTAAEEDEILRLPSTLAAKYLPVEFAGTALDQPPSETSLLRIMNSLRWETGELVGSLLIVQRRMPLI